MGELEFLHALHVDTLRHDRIDVAGAPHELFQTSTIRALLGGAFDGDVTLRELLKHGDLGLGTLNGLDGELIVVDGDAFKAELDCTLSRPDKASRTPYAVVVPFLLAGLSSSRVRSIERLRSAGCGTTRICRALRWRFASMGVSRRSACGRCPSKRRPTGR